MFFALFTLFALMGAFMLLATPLKLNIGGSKSNQIAARYYFGAEPLHNFALPIFLGIISGAYSSIFIAAQIWFLFEKKSFPTLA